MRAAEKQANFERLFRSIERAQRQAGKEAEKRREAAARFAKIVSAPRTSRRERQKQFNRLFSIIERPKNRKLVGGPDHPPIGGGGGEPEEWEEYESSLSYERG